MHQTWKHKRLPLWGLPVAAIGAISEVGDFLLSLARGRLAIIMTL
jgi:hypothetical protein